MMVTGRRLAEQALKTERLLFTPSIMTFLFLDKSNFGTNYIQFNALGVTFREYCGYCKK